MSAKTLAVALLLCGTATLCAPPAPTQQRPRAEPLPEGQLFQPLDADPKQPHFFAAWLWTTSPLVTAQIASVGLGEDIGLIRGPGGGQRRWQVSVAAGVFSQFNVQTPSNDLLNTDFVVGFPFTWRSGPLSARARVYHQSSHLGDEFILKTNPTRVNLSFEAVELLLARDLGSFRAYGGGEYIVRHEPSDLKPGLIHFGAEYRYARALLRLGGLGEGHLVAGLDAKSSQERKWQTGWSMFAGLEFQPSSGVRHLSIELQGYDGPAPYGQFYLENVQSAGFGLHFSL
jgi:opacity protein-like surface antigen